MNVAQAEIRRCPFCGGKARHGKGMKRKVENLYQKAGEWMWQPYIGCKACGFSRSFDSVEEAVEWWNRRQG
jgi:hypothetical protein